jgi:hypothetical protein
VRVELLDKAGGVVTAEHLPAVLPPKDLGLPPALREPDHGKWAWLSPLTLDVASDRNWWHRPDDLQQVQLPGLDERSLGRALWHHVFYLWPQVQFLWDDKGANNHFAEVNGVVTAFNGGIAGKADAYFENGYTQAVTVEVKTTVTLKRVAKVQQVRIKVSTEE